MKKLLFITTFSLITVYAALSQGALRGSFNASATTPSTAGSNVIIWPSAAAAEYRAMAIEPSSGDIIAVGYVNLGTTGTPNRDIIVSRFTKAGVLNTSFDTDGHKTINVNGALDDANGVVVSGSKIYVVGVTNAANPKSAYILSLNLDGSANTSFATTGTKIFNFRATTGGTGDYATCIVADGSGNLVVGGVSNSTTGTVSDDFAVARFTTAGVFDATFNASAAATGDAPVVGANIFDIRPLLLGTAAKEDRCDAIGILPTGQIILAGEYLTTGSVDYNFTLVNVNSNGTRNTTWGTTLASVPTGIVSYDVEGSNTYGDFVKSMAIDASGNIYVAGYTFLPSTFAAASRNQISIIKTNSAGALDATFDTDGKKIIDLVTILSSNPADGSSATSIGLYSSGKIVLGGAFNGDLMSLRLNADGTFNTVYGTSGISKINVGTADGINALTLKNDEVYAVGTSFGTGLGASLVPALAVFDIAYNSYALPFTNLGFIAQKQSNSVQLQWKPQPDQSLTLFTVERSTDGRSYRAIGSVNANPAQVGNYSFLDNSPADAVNYYRLSIKNADDKLVYSNALAVRNSKVSTGLEVFPNPASQLVYVQLPSSLRGKMNVRMNDVMGRTVATMSFDMMGEATTTSMNIASLNKGIYTISVVDELGSVISSKHFVKN